MKLLCDTCTNGYSKGIFGYCKVPCDKRWEKFKNGIMISCTAYNHKEKKVPALTREERDKKYLISKIQNTLFRKDSEDHSCYFSDMEAHNVEFNKLTGDTCFDYRDKKYVLKLEEIK